MEQETAAAIPAGYEEALVRTDVLSRPAGGDLFKELGVSTEDKMAFFILKWVYNACYEEDESGASFVDK